MSCPLEAGKTPGAPFGELRDCFPELARKPPYDAAGGVNAVRSPDLRSSCSSPSPAL
jgi:hypothetical protein